MTTTDGAQFFFLQERRLGTNLVFPATLLDLSGVNENQLPLFHRTCELVLTSCLWKTQSHKQELSTRTKIDNLQ